MALVTKFLEAGTDATQDLVFYAATSGTVASATDQFVTGSRSLKLTATTVATATSPQSVMADAGTQISFYFRISSLAAGPSALLQIQQNGGGGVYNLSVGTDGKLVNAPVGATSATGTTVLAVNTWYRICVSYYITNTTTYAIKVYVDGVLDSTANAGTLTRTTTGIFKLALTSSGASISDWFDNIYVATGGASSSSQPDTGIILVTAKRPFANGTTNGFTGTGTPSGYGSGNAGYVNEQPLSTTNFVSVVAAGATTEEYNIEGITVGDVNLTGATIIDYAGWLYAKALLSETASMVINNVSSNIALTSTTTLFENFAGSSTYPAGTGTDIGLITTALATTVTLYEGGIIFAYAPLVTISVSDSVTITESVVVAQVYTIVVNDSVTVTESVTMLITKIINVNDAVTVTESVNAAQVYTINVNDAVAITEAVTLLLTSFISVNDAITVTDSVTMLVTSFINVNDSVAVTEDITITVTGGGGGGEATISVNDTTTISEAATVLLVNDIKVNDSATIAESVTLNTTVTIFQPDDQQPSQDIFVKEFVTLTVIHLISVFDAVTVTEFVNQTLVFNISVFDAVTVTEFVNFVQVYTINISDAITVSEVTQFLGTSFINVFDSVVVFEAVIVSPVSFISINDSVTVAENINVAKVYTIGVNDSVTVTESVTMLVTLFINVNDSVTVTENLTLLNTENINVNDAVTVAEFVKVAKVYTISVNDSVTVTESLAVTPVNLINVFDAVAVTDVAGVFTPHGATVLVKAFFTPRNFKGTIRRF